MQRDFSIHTRFRVARKLEPEIGPGSDTVHAEVLLVRRAHLHLGILRVDDLHALRTAWPRQLDRIGGVTDRAWPIVLFVRATAFVACIANEKGPGLVLAA